MKNDRDRTSPLQERLSALAPALPVVMGYLPIGFAFGVLAAGAGVSALNSVLMSLIVFAGSAQLMAVGFISQGMNPWAIVAATFIINLRHLLMSASLSRYMHAWSKPQVAAFAFELTDETFGVHSLRFEQGDTDAGRALNINLVCQLAWIGGTLLGVLAGGLIQDVRPLGLDYALPAMFIALLMLQLRGKMYTWVAIGAGALSLLIWIGGLTQWNVILAAVTAAGVAAGVETWHKKRS
ncbi:MAG: AzlC family ABC transporter permease [Anaerolineaceae bacterium]|jgi:4-azaleucine resistance transporter AzlC